MLDFCYIAILIFCNMKIIVSVLLLFWLYMSSSSLSLNAQSDIYNYQELMNVKYTPDDAIQKGRYFNSFGAWFGFSLSDQYDNEYKTGFSGPYSIMTGKWIGRRMIDFSVKVNNSKLNFKNAINKEYLQYPGKIGYRYSFDNCFFEIEMVFISGRSLLVQAYIINISDTAINVAMSVDGEAFPDIGIGNQFANGWKFDYIDNKDLFALVRLRVDRDFELNYSEKHYEFSDNANVVLSSGDSLKLVMSFAQYFTRDSKMDAEVANDAMLNPEKYFERNEKLWEQYIHRLPKYPNNMLNALSVKALQTLIHNLRSPAYHMENYYFISENNSESDYFITDNSWFYSTAMLNFDPSLSLHHFLSLMKFQNKDGSLPMRVYPYDYQKYNTVVLNEFPMAAWNLWSLFSVLQDGQHLIRLFSSVERYHQHWYENRDSIGNGWCEDSEGYESPVINSLLYSEKFSMMQISKSLHDENKIEKYNAEREKIRADFNEYFFCNEQQRYIKKKISDGTQQVCDNAGAFALWTALASPEIANVYANHYLDILTDTTKYLEFINSEIDPILMYFLIAGLKHYGFTELAEVYAYELVEIILNENADKNADFISSYNSNKKTIRNSGRTAAALLLIFGY